MASYISHLRKFMASMFDIVLPRTKEARFLENASVADFVRITKPTQTNLHYISSLFDYKDRLVKAAIWEIKFRGNHTVTKLAAQLLYEHLLEDLGEKALFAGGSQTVIVPVPLAPKRFRERGFNQTERLARIMEELDGKKNFTVSSALVRTRETPSQTKSATRAKRLENLRGAFAISDANEIGGKHIIVLDDVATTGATIGEIRSVLLSAGAASVTGLTFAH